MDCLFASINSSSCSCLKKIGLGFPFLLGGEGRKSHHPYSPQRLQLANDRFLIFYLYNARSLLRVSRSLLKTFWCKVVGGSIFSVFCCWWFLRILPWQNTIKDHLGNFFPTTSSTSKWWGWIEMDCWWIWGDVIWHPQRLRLSSGWTFLAASVEITQVDHFLWNLG